MSDDSVYKLAAQHTMRDLYTSCEPRFCQDDMEDEWPVYLKAGNQKFMVALADDEVHAEWWRDQLSVALWRIIEEVIEKREDNVFSTAKERDIGPDPKDPA